MTIFFRVDTGGHYGLGHVQRCKTLAQALQAKVPDVPVVFVTQTPILREVLGTEEPAAWRVHVCEQSWDAYEWIRAQSLADDVLVVDTPYNADFGASLIRVKEQMPVVRLDAPWATPETCSLLVLPGMHHSADTLEHLDAAFGERLLVGAEYMMFCKALPESRRPCVEHNERIVFAAGGSDPEQALPLLYEMTRALHGMLPASRLVYMVGSQASSWNIHGLHSRDWITGFALSFIQYARLLVSTWGTTVYEALALGTPTLTIARTDSEAEDAARLEAATEGAVQSLGTLSGLMRETLCDRLVALWEDSAQRKHMHYASAGLLDGQGALRVAQAVLTLAHRGAHTP